MTSRKFSIHIFIAIALLLGSKLAFTLWPATSTTEAAMFSATEINTPAPSQAPVVQHELPSVEQSLAMLEAYIIPKAEAASAEAATTNSSALPYGEDETLTSLRSYKEELDQRARKMDARESSISEAEERVKRRITELEQLEASIQQRLSDEAKIKSKKIKRLTAVFEGMKPEKAAPVIAKMELPTVIKVFLLMDEKKVGKIMSFLPPDKAVAISQSLTRQISTVK